MRADVLVMAAELLGLAAEHYREAIIPPSGAAPASVPPIIVTAGTKAPTPHEAVQPGVVH